GDELAVHTEIAELDQPLESQAAVPGVCEAANELGIDAMVPRGQQHTGVPRPVSQLGEALHVAPVHAMESERRERMGVERAHALGTQLLDQVEAHVAHRHLGLLLGSGSADAQLLKSLGEGRIEHQLEVPVALPAGDPTFAFEDPGIAAEPEGDLGRAAAQHAGVETLDLAKWEGEAPALVALTAMDRESEVGLPVPAGVERPL